MNLTQFGNQFFSTIYSTPSGLWIVMEDGTAFKCINPTVTSYSINIDNGMRECPLLGSDSEFVSHKPMCELDISIIPEDFTSTEIKKFSDIFSIEDLKKLSKLHRAKIRDVNKRMG